MNHNLVTWVVVVLALAFLFALLGVAKKIKRKMGVEPPSSTISTKLILLLLVFFGGLAGSFFSTILTEENMWMRLFYSLAVFFLIGVPEILLIRRVHNKLSSQYLLDGEFFPFFALGFSCAIFLLK